MVASRQEKKRPYPHWHDFVGGGVSGLGARCITAPLDLLKIRRQLQSSDAAVSSSRALTGGEWNIFQSLYKIAEREGGIRSLFRDRYSSKDPTSDNNHVATAISFTSGAFAGLCATAITYPFDLCRTIFAARGLYPVAASNVTWSEYTTNLAAVNQGQLQRRPPRTLREFAQRMYQQRGLKGFLAGSAPGFLQIVPYMGLNFALHDLFVTKIGSNDSKVSGIAGMGAGVISKFLVYPLDTVKKRLQAQAFWEKGSGTLNTNRITSYNSAFLQDDRLSRKVVGAVNRGVGRKKSEVVVYDGMVDCFRQIAKRESVSAFYRGLVPSLLKSSVSTGASFWLFTLTKNVLQSIHDSD
ncbi:mitochondrial carrier protein [Skeletonema marinoi]|uniref:Mitochondrial carrier protein n=1 Tax=Skeletonema marinoi TaxID=267567 RepID=A0AAD8XRU6_9STRA|nr:mitochondrial carrier protein [Skeletonema marinoi]